jgi:hypothetical protein
MRTRRFHKRPRALLTVLLGLALTTTGWLSVAPAAAQDEAGESVLVTLAELDGSGVSGTATLTASGAQTGVTVQVAGASGVHPAHIHPGTCEAHDPTPAFPLTSVDASGASNSTIGAALADLLTGGYVVDLHLSALELGTYVACGPIVAAATTTETEPELVEAAEPVADVAAASTDTSDTTTETDQTAVPAAANVVTAPEKDTTASATTSGATNPETSIAAGHTSALAGSGSATTTTATNATSASAAASGTTTSTTAVTASGIGTTFRAAGAGSAAVALVAALLAATLAAGAMMARGREARR